MLATQNETNSCHQFRRHMERISPGSTDSCRVVEQLMCREDVPNSLQCQRSLIIAGDGATPSRHLLNYGLSKICRDAGTDAGTVWISLKYIWTILDCLCVILFHLIVFV